MRSIIHFILVVESPGDRVRNEDKRNLKRRIYGQIREKTPSHATLIAFRSRIQHFSSREIGKS